MGRAGCMVDTIGELPHCEGLEDFQCILLTQRNQNLTLWLFLGQSPFVDAKWAFNITSIHSRLYSKGECLDHGDILALGSRMG